MGTLFKVKLGRWWGHRDTTCGAPTKWYSWQRARPGWSAGWGLTALSLDSGECESLPPPQSPALPGCCRVWSQCCPKPGQLESCGSRVPSRTCQKRPLRLQPDWRGNSRVSGTRGAARAPSVIWCLLAFANRCPKLQREISLSHWWPEIWLTQQLSSSLRVKEWER